MGLDTTSYAHIEALPEDWEPPYDAEDPDEIDYDELWEQDITRAYTYSAFPRAMDGIPGGTDPDPFAGGPFIGSRWYKLSNPGPTTCSSYSRHSLYRNVLWAAFWTGFSVPKDYEGGYIEGLPFIDLIWFTDSEGILGPEACARLAVDFDKYQGKDLPENFRRLHHAWSEAVHHAAHTGCIRFH